VIRRLAAAAFLLALAAPAGAASKETDRLQIQIAGLQTQIAELQRSVEESHREIKRLNEQLAEQNASFKKTLQDQRVQEESIAAALKDISDRLGEVNERYQALKATLPPPSDVPSATAGVGSTPGAPGASPSPAGSPAAAPSPTNVPTPPPPAPRELYSQAYADFARGNYDLAIAGFNEYIRAYPNTDFTDNAQYWIGECLYGKKQFAEAIDAWNVLFKDYPTSDKLPDARVKKGMALEKLGRRSQALVEYRFVVDRFPNTQAARIARERLNP
jgi:tol-pal system protein YbgF